MPSAVASATHTVVKNNKPWRLLVSLADSVSGVPFPFPDDYLPRGQLRLPTGVIVPLTPPAGDDLWIEQGAAVFVVTPVQYEPVPISLDPVTWFSWWLANGDLESETHIFPLSVITR